MNRDDWAPPPPPMPPRQVTARRPHPLLTLTQAADAVSPSPMAPDSSDKPPRPRPPPPSYLRAGPPSSPHMARTRTRRGRRHARGVVLPDLHGRRGAGGAGPVRPRLLLRLFSYKPVARRVAARLSRVSDAVPEPRRDGRGRRAGHDEDAPAARARRCRGAGAGADVADTSCSDDAEDEDDEIDDGDEDVMEDDDGTAPAGSINMGFQGTGSMFKHRGTHRLRRETRRRWTLVIGRLDVSHACAARSR